MNFSAVILAGGKSSRMGRDKAFLEIDGQTLLARQVGLARKAGATEVFISGRAGVDYSACGCNIVGDRFPEAGPLAGIHAALTATTNPLVLVLAVDLPNLTIDLLQRLAEETRTGVGAIPLCGDKIEPLTAFYPRAALPLCEALLERQSYAVKNFAVMCTGRRLAKFIDLPVVYEACFANWNTAADTGLQPLCQ